MFSGNFISYKKSKLFYKTIGQGQPVVLIHGFGEDGHIWNHLAQSLKDKFKIIIPDIPGSGKSEILSFSQAGNFRMDDYAEAIKLILEKELINECIMIGHSMGGYITLAFAELYMEMLDGFGLFHSTSFQDSDEKIQMRRKAIDFIKSNGAQAFLKTSIPGLFTEKFNEEIKNKVEELIQAGDKFSPSALMEYYEAMINRPDRSSVLKEFRKPVLFIAGEKDKAIPLFDLLQQSHLPVISHFHILPNTAHMGMIEESESSIKSISLFLDNVY